MRKFLFSFISLISLVCSAREPYHAKVVVDATSATVSAPNLVDLSRELKSTSLALLFPAYTPTSPLGIGIDLRGLEAITFFPANSTTLFVDIPDAGITEAFLGATRDESFKLFKEYVRDAGKKTKLLRAYAKHSPIDPIAGNPTSLMAQMGQRDYLLGSLYPLSGCSCEDLSQPQVHEFRAELDVERAFCGGFDATLVTLPLRYSYSPRGDWAFILDIPISYLRNGGASSVVGSVGMGVRVPVCSYWSLTPVARVGTGGSLDLCTSGNFASLGLVSVLNGHISNYLLSMTNYAGYVTSANFWLTGINFNYRLQNYVFKNGLSLTSCEGYCVKDVPLYFSLNFEDSYFTKGNRLFMNHFDEVGFSVFTRGVNPCLEDDLLSVGFTYQFGDKQFRGYNFNISYLF